MIRIDGAAIAQKIINRLKIRPRLEKSLAVVLVGNDRPSLAFVRSKEAVARELGIVFMVRQFSVTDGQDAVIECIRQLSDDAQVGGIVAQLPVPHGFSRDALIAVLDPKKDVDNVTGRALVESPAVGVVKEVFKFLSFKFKSSKIIAVVGRGFLVGAPIMRWLHKLKVESEKLKVKIADIETSNLQEFLADADVVITGVGKAGLIDPRWLKDGAGIIDFGFPADIDNLKLKTKNLKLSFYTPTPGGTGPILVAKLFENMYMLNNKLEGSVPGSTFISDICKKKIRCD